MVIGIVLGYGTDERKYGKFQQEVEKEARRLGGFSHTVLCGGYTDRKQPKESEAGVLRRLLNRKSTRNLGRMLLEEGSVDTMGNMVAASDLLDDQAPNWRNVKIVIFADFARRRTINFLVPRIFRGLDVEVQYYRFRRTLVERLAARFVGFPKAVLSYYGLHRFFEFIKKLVFFMPAGAE